MARSGLALYCTAQYGTGLNGTVWYHTGLVEGRKGAAAPRTNRRMRREHPGAHVAFQMAWNSCRGVSSCGACGSWLCRQTDAVGVHNRATTVIFEDSDDALCIPSDALNATICRRRCSVAAFSTVLPQRLRLVAGHPRSIIERSGCRFGVVSAGLRHAISWLCRSSKWSFVVQRIECSHCHVFIGLSRPA